MRSYIARAFGLAAAALLLATAVQAQGRDDGRGVPPGIAKKAGEMPPGQAKKHYVVSDGESALSGILHDRGYTVTRTATSGNSRYIYYRLKKGPEHRAIIRPGTDRPGFSNVPAAVLKDVLARLR